MVTSDAIRALLLLSRPAAAISGTLRIELRYVVAFIEAALGSVFGVGDRTSPPSLLPDRRLLEGDASCAAVAR
jgi:hypothetical protein